MSHSPRIARGFLF